MVGWKMYLYVWLSHFAQQKLVQHCQSSILFFFWGGELHPRHMEIPRLGVKLELQLPAYTTGTATPDLSCICDLHHSSWQCCFLNPLSKATDWTCNLMVPSQVHFRCTTMGTPTFLFKIRNKIKRNGWRTSFPFLQPTIDCLTCIRRINQNLGVGVPVMAQWVKDLALPWAVV